MNQDHTETLRGEGAGLLLLETGTIFLLASACVGAGTKQFSKVAQ